MRIFLLLFLFMSTQGICNLQSKEPKNIIIFGAGYVGTVSGACLAKCGHKVLFIEPNKDKVDLLNNKKSPISEPQLEGLICQGVENGLIEAKYELGNEIHEADIAIIAVATPTTEDGVLQLGYLENVLTVLNKATAGREKPLIVSISSTILPTAFRQLERDYLKANAAISLVVNPEFLRESTAVQDFFHPPFCVVGGDDLIAANTVLSLYENICPKRFAVSGEVACLLKYACNAFHAAKITFTNEITSICDSFKINPVELMKIFSQDEILNSSSAYFKPGFSFGGSCLSKDLRALISFGKDNGNSLPLLSAIIPSNQCRFQKVVDEILQKNHHTLAILGMSFKKNSDDLRESPFVDLMERFNQAGIALRIFDPDVQPERLMGVNQQVFIERFGHLIKLIQCDLATTLAECDGVVLCKDLLNDQFVQQLKNTDIPIYDLGYFLPNKKIADTH